MNFAASFNVNVTFDNPAVLAGFVADFEKLYAKYNSGVSLPRQTQAANNPPASPQPLPPAPLSTIEVEAISGSGGGATLVAVGPTFVDLVETPPVSAPAEPETAAAVTAPGVTASELDKPKRHRRTKAEMEAARSAETAAKLPDLPKPHGGGNTGTLPPLPPMPSNEDFVMPEGECTGEHVQKAFAQFMMLGCEGDLPQVFAPLGISRVRDAKPEQYRALCEGFARSINAKKLGA